MYMVNLLRTTFKIFTQQGKAPETFIFQIHGALLKPGHQMLNYQPSEAIRWTPNWASLRRRVNFFF